MEANKHKQTDYFYLAYMSMLYINPIIIYISV